MMAIIHHLAALPDSEGKETPKMNDRAFG